MAVGKIISIFDISIEVVLDSNLVEVDADVEFAKELVNGIKINIEVVGDIDKLNELYTKKAKEAKKKIALRFSFRKKLVHS